MAIYLNGVGTGAVLFSINGTDLSDHVRSVDIHFEYDRVDVTAMNATNKAFLVGLPESTFTVEFYQDFAASKVDATLYPFLGSSTGCTVLFQTSGTTVTTTNPKYSAVCGIFSYDPVNGAVGEASTTSVEFRPVSGTGITRATS